MKEISIISTACKNCLFAEYEGNTQVGCKLHRTEKISNHPVYELIEAEDDEKEFYVLNNHICPYQRTSSWLHSEDEDLLVKVKEEVYMSWAAVVFYRHNGIDSVEKRITELKKQSRPPKVVTLVIDPKDIDKQDFKSLHQMMEDNFEIWYLQRVLQEELPDRFTADICFDKMKKHRFMFYSYFESTQSIDLNYYDKIHKFVIDDMNTYGIIKHKDDDDNIQHVTISKITHLKYGGNGNGVPIEYKIAHENKDLTWMDISNKTISNETLEDKFIIDYSLL
jgi:hypothetical protein|tara:strand:- start:43 stop:879 length:837 start_codon:yes stop_codon:yes gene_type:complete